jgi:hypothetical protein
MLQYHLPRGLRTLPRTGDIFGPVGLQAQFDPGAVGDQVGQSDGIARVQRQRLADVLTSELGLAKDRIVIDMFDNSRAC